MGQSKEVDAEVNLPLITARPAQKPFVMFVIGLAPRRRKFSGWLICNLCAISKPEKIRGKPVNYLYSCKMNIGISA